MRSVQIINGRELTKTTLEIDLNSPELALISSVFVDNFRPFSLSIATFAASLISAMLT